MPDIKKNEKTLFEDDALYKYFEDSGIVEYINVEIDKDIDNQTLINKFKNFIHANTHLFTVFQDTAFKLGGIYTSESVESKNMRESLRELSQQLSYLKTRHKNWVDLFKLEVEESDMLKNISIIIKRSIYWYGELLKKDPDGKPGKTFKCIYDNYKKVFDLLEVNLKKYEVFDSILISKGYNQPFNKEMVFVGTNQKVFGGRTKRRKSKRKTKRKNSRRRR